MISKNHRLKYGLKSQSDTSENRANPRADKLGADLSKTFLSLMLVRERKKHNKKTIKAVITQEVIITSRPALPDRLKEVNNDLDNNLLFFPSLR